MYAIVEIAGQQFKVTKDQRLYVHRLPEKEGSQVSFSKVLLSDNGGQITVGAPAIEGASVEAQVLRHLKGDKVIVFKKKRRKGYRKKNGHRQYFTEISILDISLEGKKKEAKKETSKVVSVEPEKPKNTAKKKAPASTKDDLSKIEGIGAKTAEVLNEAGINTYKELASKSESDLKTILEKAGGRMASMDPKEWPAKAADLK